MNKVYYLSTCDTGKKIFEAVNLSFDLPGFTFQDIKTEKITPEQLDEMKSMAGSYEALFSRRAIKYKEWNLKDQSLQESDYRNYILQEYTFLKRPVVLLNQQIFIGNDKKNVAALGAALK
ncbi:MAG TPA: ArsC/Spx/MgsR family protein [Niabella sp.]|nr:ArsC/Spx/MgsR family protein [Niabella sp.]HQW14383.1 ArsC/Spx/MgsR family protein [Niabella sp.]HQX18338.1 ArsC/Spx/MgsR family protein [Niabella sp.]HQX42868.1 ArsC/Spx/MgsR family protein [Niabella sp.]HRB05863.1 ArsC/Spx/MgsR family protein [Niabella sp.]